jgi:DNA-binding LacI/PurR family transcriptional regulator
LQVWRRRDGRRISWIPDGVKVSEQPTIIDVARRAKVSITTVSHVLNGNPSARVSPSTRARVIEAAGALGYAANALARGLVRQKTHHLGVVVSSRQKLLATFFSEILAGIEEAATSAGYFPLLCPLSEEEPPDRPFGGAERLDEMLRSRRVDGLLFNKEEVPTCLVRRLADEGFPLVVINGLVPQAARPIHAVTVDNGRGLYLAVENLVRLGHRRIAFVTRRFLSVELGYRSFIEGEKLDGYRKALAESGLPPEEALIREGSDVAKEPNEEAIETLLALPARPTAIVTSDDAIAISIIGGLQRRGIRVPEDLSVMGYGNLRVSNMVEPPLATVESPLREMGFLGTRMLIDLLEKRPVERPRVTLDPHLVLRQSCAPPRC